ncbi:signal peptidase I [Actinoallomurus purpureus]|uniref:signal peptidase I n=1 Tax=Actinoallomurus purpureus TaxID=478114 RepID=UPI0020938A12|nr:signal peptidase I [Actinoallomurus purpureus]MCO6011694.1 signal peptidase I [Actinoallomurus purpureus]
MTDDEQGLREPAATAGDTRHEASQNGRAGARSDDPEPGDERSATGQAGASGASGPGDSGSDDEDSSGDGKGSRKKKQGSFWKELPILIVVALALAMVIKAFAVQAFYIPSQSMENTLKVGDRVLVNKIVYHTRDIKRGDVVVFNGLDSWDPEVQYSQPSNPVSKVLRAIGSAFGVVPGEKDYIKRVIGVPGDHVVCCDAQGRVSVNGHPLEETSYLYTDPVTHEQNKPSDARFKVTVPPGRLWVMGDHREVSYDSRGHLGDPGGGTIPESRVVGRAFVVVWPVTRVKTLPIPKTFGQPGLALANDALPAVPLALGFAGAVPVTLLRRRRRRTGSSARGGRRRLRRATG